MNLTADIQASFVKKAIKGDLSAQALLYQQYAKAMFNICIRMTGKKEDAEDILHDSFILAFKKLHQLRDEKTFGGWLKMIVVNECIRVSKKRVVWSDEAEIPSDLTYHDENWMGGITLEKIHEEVKKLPEGCRQVFNLFAIEDMPHKQIAEMLQISESTSKTQYLRAKRLLRERLQKLN